MLFMTHASVIMILHIVFSGSRAHEHHPSPCHIVQAIFSQKVCSLPLLRFLDAFWMLADCVRVATLCPSACGPFYQWVDWVRMNARTFAQMLNHKLFLGANLAKKPAERILVSSHGASYVAKGNPRCIWTNRDTHPIEREREREQLTLQRQMLSRFPQSEL